jgi:hypothetical protein
MLSFDIRLIDNGFIIYIFTPDFISSFEPKAHQPLADIKIILIKNGRGNRPADAVAAGPDFSGCRVLNPAPIYFGER